MWVGVLIKTASFMLSLSWGVEGASALNLFCAGAIKRFYLVKAYLFVVGRSSNVGGACLISDF